MINPKYLWSGQLVEKNVFLRKLESEKINFAENIEISDVFKSCQRFSAELLEKGKIFQRLADLLSNEQPELESKEIETTLFELAEFLSERNLKQKVKRELTLGKDQSMPFLCERFDAKREIFEKWKPLGLLVHISPSNSINVPFLSLIEGLLSGNCNFLKLPHDRGDFIISCLLALIEFDSSHRLAPALYAGYLSISQNDLLKKVLHQADGVAVWGNEEAVEAIRNITPLHTQLIAWGPKISFAYFSQEKISKLKSLEKLAQDICIYDQQSCSSPQVVYLETANPRDLQAFAEMLALDLKTISAQFPSKSPSLHEKAEISQVELLHRMNQALDPEKRATVIRSEDSSWRILIDTRSTLQASPLYRTVWIKPLLRNQITSVLRPLRSYLQTVGLEASPAEVYDLSQLFFQVGATRIQRVGEMVSGYTGEPHDGVYSLQRYSQRVSVIFPEIPKGISYLEELSDPLAKNPLIQDHDEKSPKTQIMTSEGFTRLQSQIQADDAEIYFKTGGSSGSPKLSIFTYADYELQMKFAAGGLLAAGLDPNKDRCMNLFFAGGLYGGFLSFFSILADLRAVQFPMAAEADFKTVGKWIIDQKINVLLGMPTYLWRLMKENEDVLTAYGGIKKIFFGGEHFPPAQRQYLKERFGVECIRSAAYGSNETGPMGFQCSACEGSVHHLHDQLQHLEIIHLEKDQPVPVGEVGRMLLSSKVRSGQNIHRYEIGDLGRWLPQERCACGRSSPRFELLGRYGDVFKVGTIFLNSKKFEAILSQIPNFVGPFQICIPTEEELILKVVHSTTLPTEEIRQFCLSQYPDLELVVDRDKMLRFSVHQCQTGDLTFALGSGKLKSVVDQRKVN